MSFISLSFCCFIFFILCLFCMEQVTEAIEILFHDEANTLCVQTGLREVTVIRLIINFDGEITVRIEQIPHVEVSNEGCAGRLCIIPITKLSIDEQTVVEQSSGE